MTRCKKLLVFYVTIVLLPACGTHYVTPPGGVTMADFAPVSPSDLGAYYATQPASGFPASIAIVRVQDAGYSTKTNHGHGGGRYSIVTTRDIESDTALEDIQSLPMIAGVAPVGRLLVPSSADSIEDLRVPAARLHADMLLIYSVDTTISVGGKSYGPMSLVTLGFLPNKKAKVTATVAGVLVDVRTGYVYGTTEATVTESHWASVWSSPMVVDSARVSAEEAAFVGFVDEFRGLWAGVVNAHVRVAPGGSVPRPGGSSYFHVTLGNR